MFTALSIQTFCAIPEAKNNNLEWPFRDAFLSESAKEIPNHSEYAATFSFYFALLQ
jgi:hypothetical protein